MNSEPTSANLNPEEFRRACSRFATGVTVTTVEGTEGAPQGLTVNSFTSVSLDPPLVLVCIDKAADTHLHLRAAKGFAINILAEEQIDLSRHFATFSGDRFDGISWQPGLHGAPILGEVVASLECASHSHFDAGDHTIFVGQVERVTIHAGPPLVYFAGAYRKLG